MAKRDSICKMSSFICASSTKKPLTTPSVGLDNTVESPGMRQYAHEAASTSTATAEVRIERSKKKSNTFFISEFFGVIGVVGIIGVIGVVGLICTLFIIP